MDIFSAMQPVKKVFEKAEETAVLDYLKGHAMLLDASLNDFLNVHEGILGVYTSLEQVPESQGETSRGQKSYDFEEVLALLSKHSEVTALLVNPLSDAVKIVREHLDVPKYETETEAIKPAPHQVKVTINKRDIMLFDNMSECNDFIDSFTKDFKDNIIFGAPKETHLDYVEMSMVFYNPVTPKPKGSEVVLLDVEMPKN
ncbi:MAG: hypothetical protein LBI43_00855 [Streptococcaceae bacterium]|jgi:hypothetical protein|nr:hypothetical protein [Streptococcaceae bacterium]